jgi:hypothetical protein
MHTHTYILAHPHTHIHIHTQRSHTHKRTHIRRHTQGPSSSIPGCASVPWADAAVAVSLTHSLILSLLLSLSLCLCVRAAVYIKFTALLEPVIKYQYLRTEAFQAFRELGNCFTLAYAIDKALVNAPHLPHSHTHIQTSIHASTRNRMGAQGHCSVCDIVFLLWCLSASPSLSLSLSQSVCVPARTDACVCALPHSGTRMS